MFMLNRWFRMHTQVATHKTLSRWEHRDSKRWDRVRVSHTCQGRDGKGGVNWSSSGERERGGRWREVEERRRASFGTRVSDNVRARAYVWCRLLDRSQANAQYAATCAAHRRIGRPRGDATALRRYNYLRAFLRRYNGYFAAVVYGN